MKLVKQQKRRSSHPSHARRARTPRRGRAANWRLVQFGREAYGELRKAHWPDRQQTTRLTAAVVAFSILMAIVLGLADLAFARVADLITI